MPSELVLDCRTQHGADVQWNALDQRVWCTDIGGRRHWWRARADGESGHIDMPDRVWRVAPRKDGGFNLAYANRLALPDAAGRELENPTRFEPDNPDTRLNDGCTDRQGLLVALGMNEGTGAESTS